MWSKESATAASVTDSAGNSYIELLHFTASDKTEMSIWTAPITPAAGPSPTITVKPSVKADVGAVALEYAGVAVVQGASVLDRSASNTGTTDGRDGFLRSHRSRRPPPNELAIGFYLDSGFGDKLAGGTGYTTRANVSPEGDIELLAQDAVVAAGLDPEPNLRHRRRDHRGSPRRSSLQAGNPDRRPSRAPDRRRRDGRQRQRHVTLDGPVQRQQRDHLLHGDALIGSTAQTPTTVTGTPPATSATIGGLDQRDHLHVHRQRHERRRHRPGSSRSNAVTPADRPEGEWSRA